MTHVVADIKRVRQICLSGGNIVSLGGAEAALSLSLISSKGYLTSRNCRTRHSTIAAGLSP